MAIKFASSISSRVSTVNLERQLLHSLLSDKLNLHRTIGKHHSSFFTTQSRLFIYDCICSLFNDRHCVLTDEQFSFELGKRFDSQRDKDRIEDFRSEFNIIRKTDITDDVNVIISNLASIQLASNTEELLKESYRALEEGNYEEAADILRKKSIDLKGSGNERRIINLHKDSADLFEDLENRKRNPEKYAGIPTGFKKFDQMTGGLFPAELTIIFGLSGKGKSTFMKAISCNLRKSGHVVLHCGNEENEFQMRLKYMSADSGVFYSPLKKGTYEDSELARLKIFSEKERDVGAIYIHEFPQQTDATEIERAYHTLEMLGEHVDVIVVDYLDLMKPIGQAYSENDEQGKITSDLKQLAISCHCPVVTATQAGTQSEKQEKKDKPFLTAADVFGTKRKVHSANTLIGIVNQTATAMANDLDEKDRKIHRMVLCVPKNRDGAVFTFRQLMHVECGQFSEDDDTSDPAYNNLEKQAKEMIDDTLPPDKMRMEIDMSEIQNAKADAIHKQIEVLKQDMEKERDDFIADAPEGESGTAEEAPENVSYSDPFLDEGDDAPHDSAVLAHGCSPSSDAILEDDPGNRLPFENASAGSSEVTAEPRQSDKIQHKFSIADLKRQGRL